MTDLRPLSESSDDELERALLRSVRVELPRPSALHGTALALGLAIPTAKALAATLPAASALGASSGGALGSAATGSAASGGASGVVGSLGAASIGVVGKSLLGGALISFLALTTYDQTLGARSQGARLAAAVASSAGPAVRQPNETAERLAAPTEPVVPVPELEATAPEATLAAAGGRRTSSPSADVIPTAGPRAPINAPTNAAFAPEAGAQPPARPASASASLAAEIRVLDQARAALAAGDSERASRLLDAYGGSRYSATLAQEAALLRVRLLLLRGQRAAAADLARRTIAEHPESTHVDSLRSLAAEP